MTTRLASLRGLAKRNLARLLKVRNWVPVQIDRVRVRFLA